MVVYGATKEVFGGFSGIAAREWDKYKINVNIILPHALTSAGIDSKGGRLACGHNLPLYSEFEWNVQHAYTKEGDGLP